MTSSGASEAATNPAPAASHALKWVALAALVVQNSALIVTTRLSRTAQEQQRLYIPTTVVLVTEAVKMVLSLFLLFKEGGYDRKQFMQTVKQALFHESDVFLRLCVPAVLYTVQNNLQYIALSNLTAAAFQVFSQLKIFTTAILSVLVLGKSLGRNQWVALVLLVVGICVVQYQASQSGSSSNMTGFIAVVAATCTSGFCAVYLEKVLKGKGSIWVRNIQMAIIGLASASLAAALQDGSQIREVGFFHGYTSVVWTVIALNAGGGLIVALVVKYADNILKGFATSVSILVSCIVSALLADFVVTIRFSIGATFVLVAVALYTVQDMKQHPPKESTAKV